MKLGDFATIVQLGVGLHAGAAFFQLISELASTPLSRRLERLRAICDGKKHLSGWPELADQAADLLGNIEVQSVRLHRLYILFLRTNGGVAAVLVAMLIAVTLRPDKGVSPLWALAIILLSVAPVAFSVVVFYGLWSWSLRDIKKSATSLQNKIIG